jgi:ABC-type polysaccharide/polyol phosphate export permease
MLGPLLFLGVNTMMYSSLLYKSRLVPRPLAVMGLAGATLVLGYGLVVMFGVAVQGADPWMLLAMPIAIYEMILAGWLIIRGFNPAAIVVNSPKT